MIEDTLQEVLIDILAYLELGHTINPTSNIHDELRHFSSIPEDKLNNRIQAFLEDGLEDESYKWEVEENSTCEAMNFIWSGSY